MALNFKIEGIDEGEMIPKEFTCEGDNVSPEMSFGGIPPETKSLALIVEDPDAPVGLFVHWVIYNMPPTTKGLDKGMKKDPVTTSGFKQGQNDFERTGYDGPCPPKGHGFHRYFFILYALDFVPNPNGTVTRKSLLEAIENHVIDKVEVMGKYQR